MLSFKLVTTRPAGGLPCWPLPAAVAAHVDVDVGDVESGGGGGGLKQDVVVVGERQVRDRAVYFFLTSSNRPGMASSGWRVSEFAAR